MTIREEILRDSGTLFPEDKVPKPRDLSLIQVSGLLHDDLVYLVWTKGRREPTVCVKLSRKRDGVNLRCEYSRLKWIHERLPERLRDSVPRPLLLRESNAGTILYETAFHAPQLSRKLQGSPAPNSLSILFKSLANWLLEYYRAMGITTQTVLEYVESIESLGRPRIASIETKVASVKKLVLDKGGVDVPLVMAHGDFDSSNILVSDCRIQVCDWSWENWSVPCTPMYDLAYFLVNSLDLILRAYLPLSRPQDLFLKALCSRNWFIELALKDLLTPLFSDLGVDLSQAALHFELFLLRFLSEIGQMPTFTQRDVQHWQGYWESVASGYMKFHEIFALSSCLRAFPAAGRFVKGFCLASSQSSLPFHQEIDLSERAVSAPQLGCGWYEPELASSGAWFRYIEKAEIFFSPDGRADAFHVSLYLPDSCPRGNQDISVEIAEKKVGTLRLGRRRIADALFEIPEHARKLDVITVIMRPRFGYTASATDSRRIACALLEASVCNTGTFSSSIDFEQPTFDSRQLGSGYYKPEQGFCWVSKESLAFLRARKAPTTLRISMIPYLKHVPSGRIKMQTYINSQKVFSRHFTSDDHLKSCNVAIPLKIRAVRQLYEIRINFDNEFYALGDSRPLACAIKRTALE